MKQRWTQAVFVAVAVVFLIAALTAVATKTPSRKLKHASGPIVALAMDGPRVVYSTAGNAVYVWNIRSGSTSRLRGYSTSTSPIVQEVAIAGARVAWITRSAFGNSHETHESLYTASLTVQGRIHLASAFRRDGESDTGVELWTGKWIGGLVGAGNLLAVSRWGTKPTSDESGLTIANARLSLIGAKRGQLHVIASGEPSIVSRAVDARRVAVLRQDGSVGIYSAGGALLRQISPSSAREIAMGGGRLVVLTQTKTLEVYDPRTGKLVHGWPIKTKRAYLQVGHLQAFGRLALFSVDPRYSSRNLRILDLNTGRNIALPTIPRSPFNDATVGSLGLAYAVDSYRASGGHHPSGTLVFLSTSRVLAAIARGHL